MPRGSRRRALAAVAGLTMSLAAAGAASADTLTVPWPGLPPAGITMCLGAEQTFTYEGVLSRSFPAPNYANGETVVFTVVVSSDELSPVSGSMPDDTIVLPGDWTSLALGTEASDTVTIELAITATAVGVDDFIVSILDESMEPNPFGTLIRLTIIDCSGGSPSPSPSAAPSVDPSPSPSAAPSVDPSPSPSAAPSVDPSPSPSGDSGVGTLTPPPTNAVDQGTGSVDDVGLALAFLAGAGFVGMLAVRRSRTAVR